MNKVNKQDILNAIEYFFVEGFIDQMNHDERYYLKALLNKVANDYKIQLDWEEE